MAAGKHLILDVSVIIDLWLGVGSAEATESLMDQAAEGKTPISQEEQERVVMAMGDRQ